MLLRSLRLENIRSYTSQSVSFNDGSTLLIGDIGSGKTTILLAVEFAFFGLIKGDVSGSTLLRHGKREGSVELSFVIDDMDVKILRKLKRGKDDSVTQDSGQITVNGKVFDGTPIELKSRILSLFGYPEELLNKNTGLIYRYTVYTPQEDMKRILFESRDERLDTLRKIFNIDKYKRIRENALNYAKELRNTKKIIESKIVDLEVLKQSLEEQANIRDEVRKKFDDKILENNVLKKSHESKVLELKDYEGKISALKMLRKDLEIALINLKNKQQELQKGVKDLGMIEYRINEYTSKLEEYGDAEMNEQDVKASLDDAEEKLGKIRNAKDLVNKRLEEKEKDLSKFLVEDFAALKYKQQVMMKRLEDKDSKQKELDGHKDVLERTVIELNIVNVNKLNSTKIVNQLKDLSTCPTCLQAVDFSHKVKILDKENANIQSCERKFSELSTKKKELEGKVTLLKSEIEELRQLEMDSKGISLKLEDISRQQESRNILQKEIEELKTKKEKLDGMDINKLMDIISKSRKVMNGIEARKHIVESLRLKVLEKKELGESIARVQKELEALEVIRKDVEDKILSYANIESEYTVKSKELDTITSLLKDSDIQIAETKKDIESIEKYIARITKDIEEKNKLKDKVQYISELNFWMTEHFVNLTSTMEKSIMQKIQVEFNELFQKWFNMLIEDENIEVRVDDEFAPVILQNNYETDISNLSGGEKTSIALAYRLALNKVINDLINNIKTKDLIILDEPTDGFSSEQLDKMRDVLQELDIKQLIMVSHEVKMESFVQNIIRINKNEHNSQII